MGGDYKMEKKLRKYYEMFETIHGRIPIETGMEAKTNKDAKRIVEDMNVGAKCIIEGLTG